MRTKTRGTPRDGDLLLHGITCVCAMRATRCTSATRGVENMCVTTFAPAKACLHVSTSAPHVSMKRWRTRAFN